MTIVVVTALLVVGSTQFNSHGSPRLVRPNGELSESFSILRTPPETIPSPEEHRVLSAIQMFDPDATLLMTQLGHRDTDGSVWVILTERLMCLTHTRGTACAPAPRAIKEGVVSGVFSPPSRHRSALHEFMVQGVVPNGVRQVLVTVDNRRHLLVDVKRNLFSVERDAPVHVKQLVRD